MLFVKTDDLKTGMRLARPIYNKNGVLLYDRNSKLTSQGIVSIQNFGLIGIYTLEPAEPVPPMTEDDITFERFQAMSVFAIKEILDLISDQKEAKEVYPFANQVIKNYGMLHHKINFVQNIRSAEDYCYKHSLNTAILCALITGRLHMEFKQQLDVVVAGILHDIGNLFIPLDIRKKKKEELTEDDRKKITTCYYASYQLLNKDYSLDPNVKRTVTLGICDIYQLPEEEDSAETKKILEVEILKVAECFDRMTAMKFGEEPLSEIAAIRYLLDEANGYDQEVVNALIESIHILSPGVCLELSNGEKGLVLVENPLNILQPYVLSFKDNQVINLGDEEEAGDLYVVDIMKTMDNRHIINKSLLEEYAGEPIRKGQTKKKKHY